MSTRGILWATVIASLLLSQTMFAQDSGTCAGMFPGQLANLNGFVPFQGTASLWNTNISSAPVDPNSANIIAFIGESTTLHPDFGSGLYDGQSMGIPYQVVGSSPGPVTITLGAYADESDPGPMPIPSNALIEGYPSPGGGDAHVLVLNKETCWLFELYNATKTATGWSANSAAIWDMTTNEYRPYTWTSADAAGLPIFPGLVRYDEVAAGAIKHAIRFTVPTTREAFVAPASHWASSDTSTSTPPMGTRLRLKASFDVAGFSTANQVILNALKQYGMILADNGSAIFITGTPDSRWNNDDLSNLKTLTGSDFEVVQMSSVYAPSDVPAGPVPTISSFTASLDAITKGVSITLSWDVNWNVSTGGYNIISPAVGPVRGTSVVVSPAVTTVYTLYSTNEYGRATKTIEIVVH